MPSGVRRALASVSPTQSAIASMIGSTGPLPSGSGHLALAIRSCRRASTTQACTASGISSTPQIGRAFGENHSGRAGLPPPRTGGDRIALDQHLLIDQRLDDAGNGGAIDAGKARQFGAAGRPEIEQRLQHPAAIGRADHRGRQQRLVHSRRPVAVATFGIAARRPASGTGKASGNAVVHWLGDFSLQNAYARVNAFSAYPPSAFEGFVRVSHNRAD